MQLSCPSLRRRASWGKCNLRAMSTRDGSAARAWEALGAPTLSKLAQSSTPRAPHPNPILTRWLWLPLVGSSSPSPSHLPRLRRTVVCWHLRCSVRSSSSPLRQQHLNTGWVLGGPSGLSTTLPPPPGAPAGSLTSQPPQCSHAPWGSYCYPQRGPGEPTDGSRPRKFLISVKGLGLTRSQRKTTP